MPPSIIESILRQTSDLSSDERKALAAALADSAPEGPRQASPRRSAYGKYAGKLTPVDEFLQMKHEDTLRDAPPVSST